MRELIKSLTVRILRWTERYTKTDMVYLASGGFWLNADFVISSLTALTLTVLYAHLLSKSEYGIYQYALSLAGIVSAISLTGMNPAVAQSVARGKEGIFRKSLPIQFAYNLISSVIALSISAYYFFEGNNTIALLMVVAAITLPLFNTGSTYQAIFTGRRNFRGYFLYDTVYNVLYLLCMLAVVLTFHSGSALAAGYLIASGVITAGLCLYTLKQERPNDIPDDPNITYGKHLSVMGILGMVASQVDSVLVFHLLGPIDLAIYTFAQVIPSKIMGLLKSISSLAFSKIAARQSTEIDNNILWKITLVGGFSIFVALVYALCAPLVFKILFPAYMDAVPYSQAAAFLLVGAAAYIPSSALMAKVRKTELYILNTAYPIVQALIYFAFLYYFGLWGIIIARTVVAVVFSIFSTLLLLISDRRVMRVSATR